MRECQLSYHYDALRMESRVDHIPGDSCPRTEVESLIIFDMVTMEQPEFYLERRVGEWIAELHPPPVIINHPEYAGEVN